MSEARWACVWIAITQHQRASAAKPVIRNHRSRDRRVDWATVTPRRYNAANLPSKASNLVLTGFDSADDAPDPGRPTVIADSVNQAPGIGLRD